MGGITDSMDMSLSKLRGIVKDWEAWHAAVPRVAKSQTALVSEQQYVMLHVLLWLSLYIYVGLSYETVMSLKTKTVLSIFRSSASSSVF